MDTLSERATSNESAMPPEQATSMGSGHSSEDRLSGASQAGHNGMAATFSGLRLDTLGTMSIAQSEKSIRSRSQRGDAFPGGEGEGAHSTHSQLVSRQNSRSHSQTQSHGTQAEEEITHHFSVTACRQLAQQLSEHMREELRVILREELAREDLIQALKVEFEMCMRALQDVGHSIIDSGFTSRPPSRSTTRSGWPEAVRRASSTSTSSDPSRASLGGAPHAHQAGGAQGGEPDPCELLIQTLKEGHANFSFAPSVVRAASQDWADAARLPDAPLAPEGARPVPPATSPPAFGAALLPPQPGRLSAFSFGSDPSLGGCHNKPLAADPLHIRRKACLIGVRGQAPSQKPSRKLRRRDCGELADLERTLASELFRANNLFTEDPGRGSSSHGRLPNFCGTRQSSKTSSKKSSSESAASSGKTAKSQSEQKASAAVPMVQRAAWASVLPGSQERQRQAWLGGNSDASASFISGDDSTSNVEPPGGASGVPPVAEDPPEGILAQGSSGVSEEFLPEVLAVRPTSLRPARVPTCQSLLRQRQDQELKETLQLGTDIKVLDLSAATSESEAPSALMLLMLAAMGRLASAASPALGLLPWSSRYIRTSTLYQWAVLTLLSAIVAHCCYSTYEEYSQGESVTALVSAMDSIIASGALLGLLCVGAFWRSTSLRRCTQLLRAYASKAGVLFHWNEVSKWDFTFAVSLWLISVLLRAKDALLLLGQPTIELAYFAISAAVLIGISSFLIHMCRCLTKLADVFCYNVVEQPDFSEVVQEWSLLQSLCRAACESTQRGFLALQVTMTATVLLSIMHIGRADASRLLGLLPGLVVALAVIRTSVWAAAVTDKCARVPMLVNSLSAGSVLDPERMYCVQHIVHSQAGFYIFELRLTSTTIIKTIYVACAVAFGLATQVL